MSLLLRTPLRAARQLPTVAARRNVHFENVVGKVSGRMSVWSACSQGS
jgi:hypothetical protein